MQLAANQLSAHLAKGLRSLYTLHGDEPLLVQEAADAIRAAAHAEGVSERSVFTVSTYLPELLGVQRTCVSLPHVIGRTGASTPYLPPLADDEATALRASAQVSRWL